MVRLNELYLAEHGIGIGAGGIAIYALTGRQGRHEVCQMGNAQCFLEHPDRFGISRFQGNQAITAGANVVGDILKAADTEDQLDAVFSRQTRQRIER